MKTLAQLCPKPTQEIHWLPEHLAYYRKTIPTHFVQVRGGPCYFGWQETCYTNRDLHRPVCSPHGRRPIRSVESAHCFDVWENLGEHHHWFKKKSSRRLRKALKRELEKEVLEVDELERELAFWKQLTPLKILLDPWFKMMERNTQ